MFTANATLKPDGLPKTGEHRMPTTLTDCGRYHLHDYDKEPRPGRKLGHITVLAESAEERDSELDKICEKLTA